jgi:hypothetical protein
MGATVFESEDEALAAAADGLSKVSHFSPDLLKRLAELEGVVEETVPSSSDKLPRHLHPALVGHFAIRNDALINLETFLALLKSATKLAVGLAEYNTLGGVAATADALHGLYKFYTDVKGKGFFLTNDQLAVVTLLRELGSATTEQLAERVRPLSGQIETILNSFSRETSPTNGFVSRDVDRRWRIDGL